jgi:hypothetical protein
MMHVQILPLCNCKDHMSKTSCIAWMKLMCDTLTCVYANKYFNYLDSWVRVLHGWYQSLVVPSRIKCRILSLVSVLITVYAICKGTLSILRVGLMAICVVGCLVQTCMKERSSDHECHYGDGPSNGPCKCNFDESKECTRWTRRDEVGSVHEEQSNDLQREARPRRSSMLVGKHWKDFPSDGVH